MKRIAAILSFSLFLSIAAFSQSHGLSQSSTCLNCCHDCAQCCEGSCPMGGCNHCK
jgi:hypothetical protein